MATSFKPESGSTSAQFSGTDISATANGSSATSSTAYDNTSGYLWAYWELVLGSIGSARSSTATVEVWILASVDGTNYPDTSSANSQLITFVPAASTAAQRLTIGPVPLPPGKFKCYLVNKTGQAFASGSGANTLTFLPFRTQGV